MVIGALYLAAIAWLIARAGCGSAGRRYGRNPWLLGGAFANVAIAYATGLSNGDLLVGLVPWGHAVATYGAAGAYSALAHDGINYPPLYPDLLGVFATLQTGLGITEPHLAGVLYKSVTILSLLALPLLIERALAAYGHDVDERRFSLIVAATVLNPALLVLSAVWGQADVLVVDLVLAGAVALRCGYGVSAGFAFGLALMTKQQALFFVPVVLALWVTSGRRRQVALGGGCALLAMLPTTLGNGGLFGGYRWLFGVVSGALDPGGPAASYAGTFAALLTGLAPVPDSTPMLLGTSVLAFTVACELGVVFALTAALTYDRERLRTDIALWYFAACALLLYYFGPHMHERYIVYPLTFVVLWAFASRRPVAVWAAVSLSAAAALQFAIGFNGPKPLLFEQVPARYAFYLVYCTLNAAGVVALLSSRVAGHVLFARPAATDPAA